MSDTGRPPTVHESDRPGPPPTTHEGAPPTTHEGAAGGRSGSDSVAGSNRRRKWVLPDPIQEEFEYLEDLSSGSQADVVLCRRWSNGQLVAVKLYRGSLGRIDRDTMARLDDADPDHVVPILELRTWNDETWEVQEYFPHGSLADLFARADGPTAPEVVRDMTRELSTAVAHIHARDIVHRDLKPANVLIRELDPLDCVLADFGLATQLLASRAARSVAGTMAYTAPEATYGDLHKAADWWSLGVIVHEALTGRHLFADPETGHLLGYNQIRVALIEGAYEIDNVTDERWSLLLRGLLTHRPEHRWGAPQVAEWLDGGSPDVIASDRPSRVGQREVQPFQLGEDSYADPRSLAGAIRTDFDQAEAMLADVLSAERLRGWLHSHGFGDEVEGLFGRIDNRKVLTMRLVQLQLVLDPDSDPVFRDRALTLPGLEQACTQAEQGDRSAIGWIKDLREHQILAAWASELEDGRPLAAADERLRTWWATIKTRVSAAMATHVQDALLSCEGPLLRAALSSAARQKIAAQAVHALTGDDTLLPDWARGLAVMARTDDPNMLGVQVLAAGVVPERRETARRERAAADELARQRAEAERQRVAEAAAAERRRQAAVATRSRRAKDLQAVLLAGATCATVLVPWLLGRFVLRDTFFRSADSRVFDEAVRKAGAYFLTDWLAGCTLVICAVAVFLLIGPWRGRVLSIITAVVSLVAAIALLLPMAVDHWEVAEADSVRTLHYTVYPFEESYYTCGEDTVWFKRGPRPGLGRRTEGPGLEPWTLFSARVKGSDADGCDRVVIWHGWKRIDSIDLPPGKLVYDSGGTGYGQMEVNFGRRVRATVFRVELDDGRALSVPLKDSFDPTW